MLIDSVIVKMYTNSTNTIYVLYVNADEMSFKIIHYSIIY